MADNLREVLIIPTCFFSSYSDAVLIVHLFEQLQSQLSERISVLNPVFGIGATPVFLKTHIQVPVELIFYTPMLSDFVIEVGWCLGLVTEVESVFFLPFGTGFSHRVHHNNRLNVLPGQCLFQ